MSVMQYPRCSNSPACTSAALLLRTPSLQGASAQVSRLEELLHGEHGELPLTLHVLPVQPAVLLPH